MPISTPISSILVDGASVNKAAFRSWGAEVEGIIDLAQGPPGPPGDMAAYPAGAAGDGVTADQAAINTALASGNVILERGKTYAVSGPILIPSNRTLYVNGATIRMLAGFTAASQINAPLGAQGAVGVHIIGPGTIDSSKINTTGNLNGRQNGVFFDNCDDCHVRGITVQNCTGYGIFHRNCNNCTSSETRTLNCQIHHEQMGSEDIGISDGICGPGDGDIACSSVLHPVFGTTRPCKRITFTRMRWLGPASAGVEITGSSTMRNEDLAFNECHIHLTGGGTAFIVAGTLGTTNVRGKNSTFTSDLGLPANIFKTTGMEFTGCTFRGRQIAFQFADSIGDLFGCEFFAEPAAGSAAFGINNALDETNSRVTVSGGTINLTSTVAANYIAGRGIRLMPNVRLISNLTTVASKTDLDGVRVVDANNHYWADRWVVGRTVRLAWANQNQTFRLYQESVNRWMQGDKITVQNPTDNAGGATKTWVAETNVTIHPAVAGATKIRPRGTAVFEYQGGNVWTVTGDIEV